MKNTEAVLKWTRIFLWLTAIHSIIVGINLIVFPSELMQVFGFQTITEHFFKSQGGVFHFVMAVAYIMAALDPLKNLNIILFSFSAKLIATIFLSVYFIFFAPVIMILLSGIGDGFMAAIMFIIYKTLKQY